MPWPEDARYDPELLLGGDTRNVIDRYRYWRREAIVADLDTRRHPLHVAIENFGHDMNIGTVVRTANAFAVAAVHIVGRRRWNRRGAMVTDRYQHLVHHDTVEAVLAYAAGAGLAGAGGGQHAWLGPAGNGCAAEGMLVAVRRRVAGTDRRRPAGAALTVSIAQFGSTRSINAGVAAGIAMHAWIRQHANPGAAW